MTVSSASYLHQLTWLRGLAALFVLFSHINRTNEISYTGEEKQEFWLLNLLDLGSFGVALFFTLSGCTLYLSVSNQSFTSILSWQNFYIKRFFRIWPAFALALLLYLGAGHVLHDTLLPYKDTWLGSQFLAPYKLGDIVTYLLLTFNFTGPGGLFNNAFWSLPVEFQYYLTLPLLVILLQRFGSVALFAMVFLGHLLYKANFDSMNSTLVFRLFFTFCLGVYSGFLYKQYQIRLPCWLSLLTLSALISFVYLFKEGYFSGTPMPSEWIVYGLVSVLCVMITVMSNIRLPIRLEKVLNYYGDISYSLYLLHNLVLGLVAAAFIQYSYWLAPYKLIFLTLLTTVCATCLARFSYLYIEQPSMRIGKYLTRHKTTSNKTRFQ